MEDKKVHCWLFSCLVQARAQPAVSPRGQQRQGGEHDTRPAGARAQESDQPVQSLLAALLPPDWPLPHPQPPQQGPAVHLHAIKPERSFLRIGASQRVFDRTTFTTWNTATCSRQQTWKSRTIGSRRGRKYLSEDIWGSRGWRADGWGLSGQGELYQQQHPQCAGRDPHLHLGEHHLHLLLFALPRLLDTVARLSFQHRHQQEKGLRVLTRLKLFFYRSVTGLGKVRSF